MKKRRLWLVVLSLICLVCMSFCFAACAAVNDDDGVPVVPALTAPTVAIDEDGKATWNAVDGASGYAYKIDNGEERTAENREVQLEDGQTITVKAKGDGVSYADSEWSNVATYTASDIGPVTLDTPVITIYEDGLAAWAAITNASNYVVKIGEQETETAETSVQLEDGQSVTVKAKGDGVSYADSEWSNVETYTVPGVDPVVLDTPVVTIYKDGLATWAAITNASNYVVKIGEQETETAETSARLNSGETIGVKAVGDGASYLTGEFSASKTYKAPSAPLSAPENLTVAIQGAEAGKVNLSWNAVEGASGYMYVVNGAEQTAETVNGTSVTVDLTEINSSKLDSTWVFQVKSVGNNTDEIAADGDYSARRGSSDYCGEVEFAISNENVYTVAEILTIMNYYGDNLPNREFTVVGTIEANADGDAVLGNGFTLFGEYVPELYLAIDDRLVGIDVTAKGTLAVDGGVKGLSSYRSVDFEDIEEYDRYTLVIDTLNAWDILSEDSKIMGDFYLPVKLYGVKIDWDIVVDDTGAFVMDEYGNVTVTGPANGEDDIPVMLTATLYIDNDHIYVDEEPTFMIAITSDNRTQLAAPKVNINPKTGVATWNAIEHATGYRVEYYGFSVPGDYNSNYVSKVVIIPANGDRSVTLKDTWWIKVQALGDATTYKSSEVDPKQYNYYPETTEPDGTPLEFNLTELEQTGELSNATYIFRLACADPSVFVSASASHVVLGNDDANGAVTGTGFIKVGSGKNSGKITLNFNKKILGVAIVARQWNKDQNDKISVNGSEQQTAAKNSWGTMYFNFTASKASTKVEIDTDNRVFIEKIIVYVAD